jgi:hypothetical protein
MNKLKIDKPNVQYEFKYLIHLLSKEIMTMTIQIVHLLIILLNPLAITPNEIKLIIHR